MPPEQLNELLTEGPFAGLTVQQALDHGAALQEAVRTGGTPPAPPKPSGKTPEQILEEHAANRVDNATLLTWARLEQDDESAFMATVPDYDKYKEKIDATKKQMHPATRITRGLHKRLYENVKLEDPEVQAKFYGKEPPVPQETEEQKTARLAAEEAARVAASQPPAPPAPAPAAPVAPRAVSPAAPPTPGVRAAAPPSPPTGRVPKLKANEKIERAATAWGMPVDEYLIQLEDRGFTQADIEANTAPAASRQQIRSSAYGRTRAAR